MPVLHIYVQYDMHICMRTTLDLEEHLLKEARRKAAELETTLTKIIEEALRNYLNPQPHRRISVKREWVVVHGERPPDVDISDRDRLYDVMEDGTR